MSILPSWQIQDDLTSILLSDSRTTEEDRSLRNICSNRCVPITFDLSKKDRDNMIIGVSGCRHINIGNKMEIIAVMRRIVKTGDRIIVGDNPSGVDKIIRDTYGINGITAHWKKYGKQAGPIRNREIVSQIDRLVAFWDGHSPGTRDCIDQAMKKKIPVFVHMLITEEDFRRIKDETRIIRSLEDSLGNLL